MKLQKQFYQDIKGISSCFLCLSGLLYEKKINWEKSQLVLNQERICCLMNWMKEKFYKDNYLHLQQNYWS